MVSPLATRWRKGFRDLALHPQRTVLVVLAIAVGIVGAGSVLNTCSILRDTVTRGYLETNPPSATILTEDVDDALLSRLGGMAAVADIDAGRRVDGWIRIDGDRVPIHLFVLEDYTTSRIGRVRSEGGVWPPPDGGVVLERSSLTVAGAGMGDTLSILVGDGPLRRLPMVGVARDVGLAPGWMEHVVYAFVTATTLERLGVPPGFDRIRIVVGGPGANEARVRRVAFNVAAALESTERPVRDISIPPPGRHVHAGQMNSLLFIQGAFGLLTLLLSGVLVVNLMSAVLAEQVREIGIMKAVGGSTAQVAKLYLGMALALGLAASALGIPLAAWIGRGYAGFAASLLNFDIAGHGAHPSVLGLQLALGSLLPVAAAAVPVYRGVRVTPSAAMKEYGLGTRKAGRGPLARLAHGRRGLGRPTLLAFRNAFRRKARLALTVLGLAIGGAAFLGALNLRAGIRHTIGGAFDGSRFDLSVSLAEPGPAVDVDAVIAETPGVAEVETWRGASASLVYGDGTRSNGFPITGLPAGTERVAYPLLEGRWLEAGDRNTLVVNDLFARALPAVAVGDTLILSMEGRRSSWSVVGVVRSTFTSSAAYATRRAVARGAHDPGRVDRAVVVSASRTPGAAEELRERIERSLEEAGFPVRASQTVAEARAVLEDHILMATDFLVAMAGLIVVVGGLGLATTMNLAVLERTREIGVLRAVGASHGAVRRIVLAEGLVVGALGCVLAIPLSVPLSALVGSGFGRIMLNAPVEFVAAPSGVLLWIPLVFGISLLASFPPALRATGRSTAAALSYG